ncbi:MAG: Rieske 2Fe-2S domain-containing protein [Ferruginibacter sp.]
MLPIGFETKQFVTRLFPHHYRRVIKEERKAMKEKSYKWHKIADNIEEISFSSNAMVEIEVAGKSVCIARKNDLLFACAHKCPHAGGILADGYLDATGGIVCPLHRYKFDLKNGRNTSGEGYFLKTFPIEIRKEGVFICLEENKLFNW